MRNVECGIWNAIECNVEIQRSAEECNVEIQCSAEECNVEIQGHAEECNVLTQSHAVPTLSPKSGFFFFWNSMQHIEGITVTDW